MGNEEGMDAKQNARDEQRLPVMTTDRSPYLFWLVWIVWLPFLIIPIWDSIQANQSSLHLIMLMSITVLFAALYLWGTLHIAQDRLSMSPQTPANVGWLMLLALTLLSMALAFFAPGHDGLSP